VSNPSNPSNLVITRQEVHNIAPIAAGQLATGISLQTSGLPNVAVVAKVELRATFDAAIRKQRNLHAAAQKELNDAQAEYTKQTGTLGVEGEARSQAQAALSYLRYFYPSAAVVPAERKNAEGNVLPPSVDFPKTDIDVNTSTKTYTATMFITLHRGDQLELERTYALPQRVLAALGAVEAARLKVAAIDARIRELANEKATIPEKAEAIEAALVREQLQELGGERFLNAMDATKRKIMAACDLSDGDMV